MNEFNPLVFFADILVQPEARVLNLELWEHDNGRSDTFDGVQHV